MDSFRLLAAESPAAFSRYGSGSSLLSAFGNTNVHDLGTERVDSSQPEKNANEGAEWEALSDEQEPDADPIEKQETVSEATGDVYEAIRLINEERVKAGLNEFEIDDTLMKMAAIRAKEISVNYAHARADGSELRTIFEEFEYNYCSAAENIYASPSTASKAVGGWMNSSGHKANILHPYATRIGVGYYFDKNSASKHHWVMLATD